MADDSILRDDVVQRAIAQALAKPAAIGMGRPAPARTTKALNPTALGILGSLADGASTAYLLRRGGREDNPLYASLGGRPVATGLAVTGSGLAEMGLVSLVGKKFPRLARALGANHAANRIGLAAENFSQPTDRGDSSQEAYRKAILRGIGQR